ncbi:hypothetical protein SLS58_006187 [Diplodia intermedia]|uniref:Rhodopsin domain-containing protein n=1 Tax=Diplodia intermedia TaxID=856260 RepID=A0ABR3TNS9_9PEZI
MVAIPGQLVSSLTARDSTTSDVEYVPLINKKETVLAISISFQIVAWVAVLFRLYARFKLTRASGWDDLIVVLALWFWAGTISYFYSTTLIKVSLLLQYLRLFEKRSKTYYLIIGMTVLIALWGFAYSALLAFACSPATKFWDYNRPGKCFGFGAGANDPETFFTAFATHSATNMALDIIVFTFPIFSLSAMDLEGRRKYAIAGLATLGAVVVALSVARLASIAETRAGTYPVTDPTWLAPTSIVLSCLEVDIAVLCASIPIFWPLISALTFGKIFVVDEVIVRTEERERQRPDTPGSETELRTYQSRTSGRHTPDASKHYKDPFVVDHVRPIGTDSLVNNSHTVNVEHTTVPLGQIERLMQ